MRKHGKQDYSKIEHTHILVAAPRSKGRSLICVYNRCRYSEWWDGEQYRTYAPGTYGRKDTAKERRKIEEASHAAMRPHSLWEGEQPS